MIKTKQPDSGDQWVIEQPSLEEMGQSESEIRQSILIGGYYLLKSGLAIFF